MLERILLPLDGSPLAEAILGQVGRLLMRSDSEVIVLRAVDVGPGLRPTDYSRLLRDKSQEAEHYCDALVTRLSDEGARVRRIVCNRPPAEAILETAEREKATLIAMATHGRTGLTRWVFGNVTEKVLRASPIPVLAMRSFRSPEQASSPGAHAFARILLPIDASDLSLAVIPAVVELASLFRSHVTLVNAIEDQAAYGPPVPQMAQAHERLRASNIPVEPVLAKGDAASAILETCRTQSSDMIAMSTHGSSGVRRWALGSVTEKVLRSATVPMLVVRQDVRATC